MKRQLQRMTNEELQALLVTDDMRVLDYIIDQKPIIKRLERERRSLKKQVLSQAEANYAREPELVRARLKLRAHTEQLARMVRQCESSQMEPILLKLNEIHNALAGEARRREEESETVAKEFLDNRANKSNDSAATAAPATAPDCCSRTSCEPVSASSYEHFIRNYVGLRQAASKKRVLADRLAKERDQLLSNMTYESLILTGKQKQSAMAAEAASISSADSLAAHQFPRRISRTRTSPSKSETTTNERSSQFGHKRICSPISTGT